MSHVCNTWAFGIFCHQPPATTTFLDKRKEEKQWKFPFTLPFFFVVSRQPNRRLEHRNKIMRVNSAYLGSNGGTGTRVQVNSWKFHIKRETRAWAVHSVRQNTNFSMGMGSNSKWVPSISSTHLGKQRPNTPKLINFKKKSATWELACRNVNEFFEGWECPKM